MELINKFVDKKRFRLFEIQQENQNNNSAHPVWKEYQRFNTIYYEGDKS